MKDIIISDNDNFLKVKNIFESAGKEKVHILADFDGTLTNAFINNEKVPSIISVLRDGSYLSPGYSRKAHELYNKYHIFENDHKISKNDKKRLMEEWWRKHFELLIKSGLNKRDIEEVVKSPKIKLREGFPQFLDILDKNNIPLIIMSSSGLGKESIYLKLKQDNKLYDNIYIISNSFNWDEKGNAVSINEPIIHGANKDETLISIMPDALKAVKDRGNVILLGNSLGDADMAEGFDYDNLIKFGFLNDNIEDNLDDYKKIYDAVIINDSSFDFITSFLKDIL